MSHNIMRLEPVDDIKSVVGKDNILNLALYCHKRAKDNILPKLADISGDLKLFYRRKVGLMLLMQM